MIRHESSEMAQWVQDNALEVLKGPINGEEGDKNIVTWYPHQWNEWYLT